MSKAYAGPRRHSRSWRGMGLPQSLQALDDRICSRVSVRFVVFATMAVAAPAFAQTGKPADAPAPDRCAGVMERLNQAHTFAPDRYTKTLMVADNRCLGVLERIDKARMITRDEYLKAYKRQPDCSAPAYSYLCE